MSNRWFYTDPLAAAWMGKHFGMRFVDEHDGESQDTQLRHLALACAQPDKFCIHPDSLHLLKVETGDVVRGSGDYAGCRVISHSLRKALRRDMEDYTIILRNGTPFMWPEQET